MGFSSKTPAGLVSFLFLLYTFPVFSQNNSSIIRQGQTLTDRETIISPNQVFELGFFSPRNSSSRYLGIWYYGLPGQTAVVWVANRNAPISGNSGAFGIRQNGSLVVSDGNGRIYWSSNSSSAAANLTAMITDTGNFILSTAGNTGDDNNAIWQSCDYPTDTYLPNMRIYLNTTEGDSRPFVSWRSPNDPSEGNYSMGIDLRGSPQVVLYDESGRRLWRSGQWNNQIFTGVPQMRSLLLFGFRLNTADDGRMYFIFTNPNTTLLMRFTMQWNGVLQQLTWDGGRSEWTASLTQPATECEQYNRCGSNAVCGMRNTPSTCTCMEGFEANSVEQWNRGNYSGGCRRRTPLQCGVNVSSSDGFSQRNGIKMPDLADRLQAGSSGECEDRCSRNCSCNAYAYVSGIGCLIWGGNLVDVEQFEEGGETLFIRLARSELGKGTKISQTATIAITVTGTVVLGGMIWLLWRNRGKLKEKINSCWKKKDYPPLFEAPNSQEISVDASGQGELPNEKPYEAPSLPLFSFSSIETATEGFANKNKLGQGGFGPVHKGILPGGQEIAVKRLSKWSGQGLGEFQNEMILIAKLQHRNLVRLLGYCIEEDEKMLIYEYMPNKSLDTFLFDPKKKAQLDWTTRFTIIEGIARGLLYLHRDSRLRIIHRDLKVSNILLDEEMNPKISDFGMARIFGGNQNEANTNRVVGTYGYMAPEYAMEGLFSVKSDVYSFGVLLLEIVSGQRNTAFRNADSTNLIRYAWNLWKDGKPEELIDSSIADSCNMKEVLQCIHVGMLCVQLSAVHRPTMSSVLFMLEGENTSLPQPRTTDFASLNSTEMDLIMEGREITVSSNDVTVTEVMGR